MGEVKRYDIQIDNGCSEFDSPCIEQVPTVKGQWVEYSDYAALEATLSACEAECTAAVADRNAALLKHEALEAERDALRAEVAKLNAACAHRLEALRGANHRIIYGEWASDYSHSLFAAALSTDAGKGWIDATGAVNSSAYSDGYSTWVCPQTLVPDEWAGSRVLIVRVP